MSSSIPLKYTQLYAFLLSVLIILFLVVFNRKFFSSILFKPEIPINNVNYERANNIWNKTRTDSAIHLVKNGDLVVRAGNDAISNLFKKMNNKDQTYSHAGLIFIENGYPFVYNVIGNAHEPNASIKRDSLNSFISGYDNLGFAVYRFALNNKQIKSLHRQSINYYLEKIKFDPYFDLETDQELYCTEFIYKAITKATGDNNFFPYTQRSEFKYISVDNLFISKGTKLICKITYVK